MPQPEQTGKPSEDRARAPEPWRIELGELDRRMGLEVHEQSPQRVVISMPGEGNRPAIGLLHGGAMVAMAEAAGSWAAVIHGSLIGRVAVGLDINATHHRSSRQGRVFATATAIHLGSSTTTHEVVIEHEDGARLCTARITNFLKDAPAG